MKLVVCRLPDEVHEGLRRLAFERRTSVAQLIRRAIDESYREDLEDIRDMEEEIAAYQADASIGIEFGEYVRSRPASASG